MSLHVPSGTLLKSDGDVAGDLLDAVRTTAVLGLEAAMMTPLSTRDSATTR
ncbi:MAG: hypothetical protein R3B46_04390 [Phycisphaerales bacterium]